MMDPIVLQTEKLSKTYIKGKLKVQALQDVSVKIESGSCVLIRGPSGSGKTTFLSIIGCLLRPTSGEVWVNQKEVSYIADHFLAELRRNTIGFVFQQFNLIHGLRVVENVAMPLVPMGISEKERNRRALALLSAFNLKERAYFFVNELSGGEQQRVALARALINEPMVILADEPTSNIDEQNAKVILDTLFKLKEEGKTVVIASHDAYLKESSLFDTCLNIIDGRLS